MTVQETEQQGFLAGEQGRSIRLRQPESGRVIVLPLGYSWATALLGPLPWLLRGCWRLAGLVTLATVVLPLLGQMLLAAHVQRLYLRQLLRQGWRAWSRWRGDVSAVEWRLGLSLPRDRNNGKSGAALRPPGGWDAAQG